jgi:predicted AAA+ superfamily ATPase
MYERFAKSRIEGVLADTPVVPIPGPRQFGKTTLATDIAAEEIPFFTLDDVTEPE